MPRMQIKVIIYFTQEELRKLQRVLRDLGLAGHRDVVVIDARSDNKPSGSQA